LAKKAEASSNQNQTPSGLLARADDLLTPPVKKKKKKINRRCRPRAIAARPEDTKGEGSPRLPSLAPPSEMVQKTRRLKVDVKVDDNGRATPGGADNGKKQKTT